MSHTIRFRMIDGTYHEVEVTDGQLLDYGAGHGIAPYTARDERIIVDDDGTITTRESAIPQMRDEAA